MNPFKSIIKKRIEAHHLSTDLRTIKKQVRAEAPILEALTQRMKRDGITAEQAIEAHLAQRSPVIQNAHKDGDRQSDAVKHATKRTSKKPAPAQANPLASYSDQYLIHGMRKNAFAESVRPAVMAELNARGIILHPNGNTSRGTRGGREINSKKQ